MAKNKRLRLTKKEAELLNFDVKENEPKRNVARYYLNSEQEQELFKDAI